MPSYTSSTTTGSSSRSPYHSPASTNRSSRRPGRTRLARSAVIFVLSLCVPYVSASPLPETMEPGPSRQHRHHPSPHSSPSSPLSAINLLHDASKATLKYLVGRDKPGPSARPIITFASYDSSGFYRMPDNYVRLVQRFNGGFIVLSVAIAFVGSLCTLELLIRRTTNSGWRNQILLLTAGITFGAVSTFAMHFIFNNSLSLHHPLHMTQNSYPAIYLSYDPGYTVASLVASCSAMTIAFFVMGTSLNDWWIPGRKRHGGTAHHSSANGHGGDEYGNWKSAHKKVLRRGTMGVGALLQQAGSIAKWSLMPPGAETEKEGGRYSSKKGGHKGSEEDEGDEQGPFGNSDEDYIQRDKKLADLDFRLGRSAVNNELERRQESSETSGGISSTHHGSAVRLIPSNSSLPRSPLPVFHPPNTRRRSLQSESAQSRHSPDYVFTPGYSFQNNVEAYTAEINSTPIPAQGAVTGQQTSFPAPGNSGIPDVSHRRASLPSIGSPLRPEAHKLRTGVALTRIQSMAEVDSEQGPNRMSIDRKVDNETPYTMVSDPAHIQVLEAAQHAPSHGRRVRVVSTRTLSTVEKFLGFDVVTTAELSKICITGTLAGCGVAAMHYIGQFSIIGMPYIAYKAPYVVGSVIIASGAVIIALYIMFIMLRPKLKHTWLSKLMVAAILSVAVCAMHFCGMMGTIYGWPRGEGINRHEMLQGTNRVITAIVAALAFLTCIACGIFFFLHSLRQKRERARRRRVVIAAVFLDSADRVLVDASDGMLPMCDIASLTGSGELSSSKRSVKSGFGSVNSESTLLGMDLTPGHDAFVSALKMSWTWKNPNLAPSNPAGLPSSTQSGQATLAGTIADIRRGSMTTIDSSAQSGRQSRISVTKFLERFAISAGQLSSRLIGQQNGISRLGVLYDQILTTGWVKLNNSNDTVSKGQLIFLVRRVTSPVERTDLLSRHYIFADPEAVASALHKTLSVPLNHTLPLLQDIRLFCDSTMHMSLKPSTVYAGVAVVQATPFDGLRLLLEQDNRSQLPMREICSYDRNTENSDGLSGTLEELGEALTWLEGMNLLSVITRNMSAKNDQIGGPRVTRLLSALERALVPMLDDMLTAEDMAHILPRLFLHPVLVPLTPNGSNGGKAGGYAPPYIIVFYAHYDAAVNTFTDKWLPFSLFRAQNACVMAPQIQAVSDSSEPAPNTALEANGVNYQRRPSRVQFEFPLEAHIEKEPISRNGTPDFASAPTFSGFSFPPKDEAPSPISAVPRSLSTKGGGGPRRSSLARSQFNTANTEIGQQNSPTESGIGKEASLRLTVEVAPGVASWDPDWLLVLLRTKLRADA